jgi:hypothetical protein
VFNQVCPQVAIVVIFKLEKAPVVGGKVLEDPLMVVGVNAGRPQHKGVLMW